MIIATTQRTAAITAAPSADSASALTPSSPSSLLPEPEVTSQAGIEDAMSMMYELVAKQGQLSMSTGEAGVTAATKEQQAQAKTQEDALNKQEAEEAKADSFWGKLESILPEVAEYVGLAVAAVGAAALTVVTCGTAGIATAAVVVALSASGIVASKTKCFGADSGEIGAGLEIASAVVSFGATSAVAASSALITLTAAADAVGGAADVASGAATVETGVVQADILDDAANVQQASTAINRDTRMMNDLVTGLQASQKSNANALQVLAGASQTYAQTLVLASAGKA
jgi:hypothetical protein